MLSSLKIDSNESTKAVIEAVDAFKNKSRGLDECIEEIKRLFDYENSLQESSNKFSEILSQLRTKSNSTVESLKFGSIKEIKFEPVINKPLVQNQVYNAPQNYQNPQVQGYPYQGQVHNNINPYNNIQGFPNQNIQGQQIINNPNQNNPQNLYNQNYNNQNPNNYNPNSDGYNLFTGNNSNNKNPQIVNPNPVIQVYNPGNFIEKPQIQSLQQKFNSVNSKIKKYVVHIATKKNNTEMNVFYKNKFYTSSIENGSEIKEYPMNSKMVHLEEGVFICGGTENKVSLDTAYIIMLGYSQDKITQSIIPYPKMNEKRERHNVIYLENRNVILVCSGFNSKTTEMIDLQNQKWETLPNLNEVRSNGTLAYINDRFVYAIGGFKPVQREGVYTNSVEFLDFNSLTSIRLGWKNIELSGKFNNIKLSYSAMGVINIDKNSIYLVGGFDGKANINIVHQMDIEESNGEIYNLEKTNLVLPSTCIFVNNGFSRSDGLGYCFEFHSALMSFNPEKRSFSIVQKNN